jgi:hypothetical protein
MKEFKKQPEASGGPWTIMTRQAAASYEKTRTGNTRSDTVSGAVIDYQWKWEGRGCSKT